MSEAKKRKDGPSDERDPRGLKRSKGGSGGKWQTPHQASKNMIPRRGGPGKIEPGDVGIWVTCAKGQEGRATEELKDMFEECAERFYGLIADDEREDEDLSIDDIESSIQNEVALLGKKDTIKLFTPVFLNIQCVLFFKTEPSIDPVDFVHRICEEIVLKPGVRRMRYVNRLTPVTMIAKASEKGLEEVGKKVLGEYFQLAGEASQQVEEKGNLDRTRYSYAIRPSIRNHTTLKRDAVIKQVASLVGEEHKVDLANPDKVIIVEIYQTVCGMSVVGNDWETLKRFNLAGLYQISGKNGDATPKPAKTDEAQSVGPRARSETTDNLT